MLPFPRGFRGSEITSDGTLIIDFPQIEQLERQLTQVNLNQPTSVSAQELKETRARQYGSFLLVTKPAKKDGPYSEDVILEMQEARTLKSLWTKACVKEAPSVWVSAQNETMVLSWPVLAKAAQAEIKGNSALSQQLKGLKEKEGDYLLQIRADGEVDDRARLDPVRIEIGSRVDNDEGRGKEIIGVIHKIVGTDTGDQSRVVADIRAHPISRLGDVVDERPLRLQFLIVIDQEWSAGNCVERSLIEEQTSAQRRHIHRVCMA